MTDETKDPLTGGIVETTPAPAPSAGIPHVRVVVGVTFAALFAFAAVTAYVLAFGTDETIRGAVIGAWSSMATGAAAFWLGSSSGGKLAK